MHGAEKGLWLNGVERRRDCEVKVMGMEKAAHQTRDNWAGGQVVEALIDCPGNVLELGKTETVPDDMAELDERFDASGAAWFRKDDPTV
jgi:hypothetical protein